MPKFQIDFLEDYSKEAILGELRRVAALVGKTTVTQRDLKEHGRVSHYTVIDKFGTMRAALHQAGLASARFMKATDDELLGMLIDLWVRTLETAGRRPFADDLKKFGFPVSHDTYKRRFGSWRVALVRASQSVQDNASADDEHPAPAAEAQSSGLTTRRAISLRKRFFVLKRDSYRCRLCGASGVPLEVDHVVPVSRGGSDALVNLQSLCEKCNRGKRDSLE